MEYCNLQRLNADLKHYICGQSSLFLLLNISKEILHFFFLYAPDFSAGKHHIKILYNIPSVQVSDSNVD